MSELSPARLAADRANAQKSTGPITPEGKATSALNSLVHGLRAATVVPPSEDADDFEAMRQKLYAEYKPQTMTEQHLINTVATSRWAINRARRQKTAVLTQDFNRERPVWCAPGAKRPVPVSDSTS